MPPAIQPPRAPLPLIGVSACRKATGHATSHCVGDKYVDAVIEAARGLPLIIPAVGSALDIEALLDRLDGVLLTGSPSNLDPELYGGGARPGGGPPAPAPRRPPVPLVPPRLRPRRPPRRDPCCVPSRGRSPLRTASGCTRFWVTGSCTTAPTTVRPAARPSTPRPPGRSPGRRTAAATATRYSSTTAGSTVHRWRRPTATCRRSRCHRGSGSHGGSGSATWARPATRPGVTCTGWSTSTGARSTRRTTTEQSVRPDGSGRTPIRRGSRQRRASSRGRRSQRCGSRPQRAG